MGGGMVAAISLISSSLIIPGPLGMAPTNPSADAPNPIACRASSWELIQQTFILGFINVLLITGRFLWMLSRNKGMQSMAGTQDE